MKPTNDLFLLIKSLESTEKSYFKKFTRLHILGDGNNYIRLFEAIEKQTHISEEYDETLIRKKFKGEAFLNQLWVAKHYLYHQILRSLEVYHLGKDNEIKSLLRRIELLYEKGLYSQCGKIIVRAKETAFKLEKFSSLLELLKWELKIFQVHSYSGITTTQLDEWHKNILQAINKHTNQVDYSFAIAQAFSKRKKSGFARKKGDIDFYSKIVNSQLFEDEKNALSFEAKNNFYLIHSLYNIARESPKTHYYTKKQVELFDSHPEQIQLNAGLYLTTLHNHIVICRRMGRENEIANYIEKIKSAPALNSVTKGKKYFYSNANQLKLFFNSNKLKEAIRLADKIRTEKSFYQNEKYLNPSDKTALYYDLGFYFFVARQYKEAAKLFHTIVNDFPIDVKSDFHCFSRILLLLVYFESGKFDLLEYAIKTTYKYLKKNQQLYKIEEILLLFLRNAIKDFDKNMKDQFQNLHTEMEKCFKDPFEKTALNYFDFLSWAESKIKRESLYDTIRKNRISS